MSSKFKTRSQTKGKRLQIWILRIRLNFAKVQLERARAVEESALNDLCTAAKQYLLATWHIPITHSRINHLEVTQ